MSFCKEGLLSRTVFFYKTSLSVTDETQREKAGKKLKDAFCFSLQFIQGTVCS